MRVSRRHLLSHDVMLKKRLLIQFERGRQRRERMWLFPGRSSLGILKLCYFFSPPNYVGTKERANLVRLIRGRVGICPDLQLSPEGDCCDRSCYPLI